MPCKHRFQEILIPELTELRFLFIGTFNPEWNADNGNNATYFYGRASSLFWCILPHAFNANCLIDMGIQEWGGFCNERKIGLTDLISCVRNADINNQEHVRLLTRGFRDENLEQFELDFTTEQIIQTINANCQTLRGVFFTRLTNNGIPIIWRQWSSIVQHCQGLGIYTRALPTPSTRGGTIRNKIIVWREEVERAAGIHQ